MVSRGRPRGPNIRCHVPTGYVKACLATPRMLRRHRRRRSMRGGQRDSYLWQRQRPPASLVGLVSGCSTLRVESLSWGLGGCTDPRTPPAHAMLQSPPTWLAC
eukprot:scaffold1667_cov411-Prasinococcus_capsulatus_cf.AAC.4